MRTFYSLLLLVFFLISHVFTANAVPAFPGLIQKKQPDGTTISVYLKGDEKVHWMESEDGYSLLYDGNHTVVYAVSDGEGMVPSSVEVRNVSMRSASDEVFLKSISKKLKYSSAQINTLKSVWETVEKSAKEAVKSNQFRASTGKIYAICTLVDFPDIKFSKSNNDFKNLMNQIGYGAATGDKGSVHDYYLETSYGKIDMEVTVAGPYTLSQKSTYYGANNPKDPSGSEYTSRVQQFAQEAAQKAFGDTININPAKFDNDGDGYIDAFHIIYAGYGEEAGAPDSTIWAHAYGFQQPLTFGSNEKKKLLDIYSCSPELRDNSGNNITHIGVICHELGHIFGAPDFYDVDGTDNGGEFLGTGSWDLMASGSWNYDGACPAHINMYEEIQLGWVTPTVLNQKTTITNMASSATDAVAYRYDTSTSGEYFILENRQKKGFDSYVPGSGLLIYHVSVTDADISANTVNNKHPQKIYPVCASATSNPTGTVASYGNINSQGCPFPGTSGNTSFTDYTIPSAISWKGANTLKPVTEIKEQNSLISFNFMKPDAEPVTNLQTTVTGQSIKLTWTKPVDDNVIGYNIYRDEALLIKLTGKDNTAYTQYNVSSGTYNYCVTALYTGKESSPVCQTTTVSNSSTGGSNYLTIQNLTAQNINGNKDIQIDWQSPFVSDWMTIAQGLNYLNYLNDNVTQFSAVARYTTDDLQKFQGSTLTKVRFAIGNLNCKYTIQVWTKDPGLDSYPSTPIVSQAVTNPTKTSDNFEVTLNSPVTVAANKEIWIGIQYALNPMTYVAGSDAGPMVEDRNFSYYGNKWYAMASGDKSTNWYIAGYMDFGSNTLNAPANEWLRSTTATTATATKYIVYRDNQKIGEATQSNYVDSQPAYGSHIYCVSIAYNDGKESEQQCVEAFSSFNVDVPKIIQEGEINIYPNPIKKGDNLIIHCESNTVSTLSIYGISGQLIQQEQITGTEVQKRMDFEPGMYVLQIKNNTGTFIRKIIIK
jgi:M6 family metalloprotease-like protein